MSPNEAFDFVMTHYQINADEIAQTNRITGLSDLPEE